MGTHEETALWAGISGWTKPPRANSLSRAKHRVPGVREGSTGSSRPWPIFVALPRPAGRFVVTTMASSTARDNLIDVGCLAVAVAVAVAVATGEHSAFRAVVGVVFAFYVPGRSIVSNWPSHGGPIECRRIGPCSACRSSRSWPPSPCGRAIGIRSGSSRSKPRPPGSPLVTALAAAQASRPEPEWRSPRALSDATELHDLDS